MSPSPDSTPAPAASLEVRCGVHEGECFALSGEETLLGRSPSIAVTLGDEGVSREHALVSYDAVSATWTVEDLQSTNGTRVNGKRIRSSPLSDGDEIQIGNTRLVFRRP